MLDLDRSDELMLAKSEAVSPESETSPTQMDIESLWHPTSGSKGDSLLQR